MKVSGRMTYSMEKESIISIMAVYMKVNFIEVKNMAKERLPPNLDKSTKADGKMTTAKN